MYIGGYGVLDHVYVAYNEMGWNASGRQFLIYGHTCSDSLTNFYFYNNYLHDASRQVAVIGGGEGCGSPYDFVNTAYIYNNIFDNPSADDFVLQVGGYMTNGNSGTYYIYNNIIYQPHAYPALYFGLDTFVAKNNIIVNTANGYDYYVGTCGSGGTCSGDNNIWYGCGADQAPSWDSSTLDNTDPLLTNSPAADLADYFPQSEAPSISVGEVLTYGAPDDTKDFYGVTRGTSWDIGPFEYTAEGAPLEDAIPDPFSFTDITNADRSTVYTSNEITVAGIDEGSEAVVTITGGTYSKNEGEYTSDAGTAELGDTFTVRHTSSASYSTATNTALTIGGVSDTYTTTTLADAVAPTTTITQSDPQAISSDTLVLTGTSADDGGVASCKWRLTSAPDATHGTACTGTTSWSCSTSGYAKGANTMFVGCADAVGNWGSDSLTVNFTIPFAGAIEFSNPGTGAITVTPRASGGAIAITPH